MSGILISDIIFKLIKCLLIFLIFYKNEFISKRYFFITASAPKIIRLDGSSTSAIRFAPIAPKLTSVPTSKGRIKLYSEQNCPLITPKI